MPCTQRQAKGRTWPIIPISLRSRCRATPVIQPPPNSTMGWGRANRRKGLPRSASTSRSRSTCTCRSARRSASIAGAIPPRPIARRAWRPICAASRTRSRWSLARSRGAAGSCASPSAAAVPMPCRRRSSGACATASPTRWAATGRAGRSRSIRARSPTISSRRWARWASRGRASGCRPSSPASSERSGASSRSRRSSARSGSFATRA